ncbi:hypothetical protein CBER1_10061 [Cercospora berteroae]|uniref:Uncharacterized protein n=1 Tax=Cercospora berteroae TaxID=357750 RepID=A0A2S6BV66_9PEZI|nr:hypothetical protein CBER1_10061 [Cercospora berteroae]
MADPAALALQVGVLIKNLIEYGHEVKGAQEQITSLCRELSALRGVLEDVKAQRSDKVADNGISDCLANARLMIDDLLHRMQPSGSRLQRGKQSWLWPFKQKEIEQILARLGRINTFIIMIMMGAQQSVTLDMQVLRDELRSLASMVSSELYSQNQKRIMDFLAPVSPDLAHDEACSVWEGTHSGTWFVDILQPWLDTSGSKRSILALYGSSGAGKTTVISKAVEHVRTKPKRTKLCYFYCMFNDEASRDVRNILGSWLVQLAAHKPSILDPFDEVESGRNKLPLSLLEDALVEAVENVGPTILVLDAVNESRDEEKLRECMLRLTERCKDIRFVVSSTPYAPDLMSTKCMEVNMGPEEVDGDIEQYVRRVVSTSHLLAQAGEQGIVDVVVPQARGMFRWAECQMSLLSGCLTAKMVTRALTELPGSLDFTYMNILRRTPIATRPWVREILMWLSYAYRPLTLEELAEAVVIETGQSSMDDSCRIQPPETVLRLCQGLVAYTAATNTISLAHSSVRATLESRAILDSDVSEFGMSREECTPVIISKSLTYLLLDDFDPKFCHCDHMRRCLCFESYPFFNYAGKMWAVHASMHLRRGNTFHDSEIEQMFTLLGVLELHGVKTTRHNFALWMKVILGDRTHSADTATPLYYAASFGLEPVVEITLSQGLINFDDPNNSSYIDWKSGRNSSTPLEVACYRRHIEVAELLLRYGADPNSTDVFGNSCLDYAVKNEDRAIISLLLRHGANGPTDTTMVAESLTMRFGRTLGLTPS